jgi:cytochrome P450
MMELGLIVFFFLLAAALLAAAARAVRVVPQATVMIVERLGRFYKLADSGLHVLVPSIDRPRGEMTFGVIGSANRDESVFENPDTLDITREPNRHLSFGQGIHFCLGAPLARMEAQIAVNTLLSRMPNLRLKVPPERLHWRPSMVLRGLDSLPVQF